MTLDFAKTPFYFFFAPKSRPQPSHPSPFPTIFFGQRLLIPLKRTSLSSRASGQADRGCACQVFAPGACGLIKGAALVAEGTQAQTNQHGTQKKMLSYRCMLCKATRLRRIKMTITIQATAAGEWSGFCRLTLLRLGACTGLDRLDRRHGC